MTETTIGEREQVAALAAIRTRYAAIAPPPETTTPGLVALAMARWLTLAAQRGLTRTADCHARRTAWFVALVWDMLQAMPPSHAALAFAVRAGRLGVTDEHGRPLAMACASDEDPWAEANAAGAE